jgi:hypothetical protein
MSKEQLHYALQRVRDRFFPESQSERDRDELWQLVNDALAAHPEQAKPMTGAIQQDSYKQADGSKNCMQCSVAYLLGLPTSDVPDFEQAGPNAWEQFYSFISDHGFTAEMFPPTVDIDGDYLASGYTTRGTSHMVVMRGGELLHDPHPSNDGLKLVQVMWLIARKAPRCITDKGGA